jgi:anion-transporting  ArsA/GET3 family ATPase
VHDFPPTGDMTHPSPDVKGLLGHRLIVVTGKGGVGKTTVAAAIGLEAARRGRRTIVAEVARRTDVAGALTGGPAGGGALETELAPGLFHISVDPELALEEYLRDQLPPPAAGLLARSRVFGLLAAATPGLRELLTVGKLWELAQLDRRTPGASPYDLVIVDAPATGHGVAVLSAPQAFADAAHTGPVARQARTIHATLSDPDITALVAVARADELAVTETLALQHALRERLDAELDAIVVNALEPDRFTPAEARRLSGHAAHPAVERALAAHARARRQRAQLGRLTRASGRRPLRLHAHARSAPDLAALADELGPQLP